MSLQGTFTASLLCFAAAVPSLQAQGNAQVKLQFKAFDPDSKPVYQLVEVSWSLPPAGYAFAALVHWTPQPAEGEYRVVKRRLAEIRLDNDLWFDLGTLPEVTIIFDAKSAKIKELRGQEQCFKKLTEKVPDDVGLLREFLGKEEFFEAARQPWFGVPANAVTTGSHLESDNSSQGSVVFDRTTGRALESSFQVTMRGRLVWATNGEERTDGIVYMHKVKFTTSDEMPKLP